MTKPKTKPKATTRSTARKIAKAASRKRTAPASFRSAARPNTKHARIIAMLRTPAGATIATLMTATDWRQHSVRGFLAGVVRRPAPSHLTRHLLFAVIAYRLQAGRFGDLDHATLQVLDGTAAKEAGPAMSARLASFDQKRTELTPGTVLVREWDRQSQRVMVRSW